MDKFPFQIHHFNNELKLRKIDSDTTILSSYWYMEFGKSAAEVTDSDGNQLFSMIKKFQFWKWKMCYFIRNATGEKWILQSKNAKKTIFELHVNDEIYTIKEHYHHKKSIFKNETKITEFDERNTENTAVIHLLHADLEELQISFLLYSCLFIGRNDFNKSSFTSQKQLEKNGEPWF